jgi:hypothetical protein
MHPTGFLNLRRRRSPTQALPRLLRRLLPDLEHAEGWTRYQHADLELLNAGEREREAWQLRVALALIEEPEDAPEWVLERLRRLEGGR